MNSYMSILLALIFLFQQTAIPILIGTKFDDFAQLPLEMQWAIVNQVSSTRLAFLKLVCLNRNLVLRFLDAFSISNVVSAAPRHLA
jgi:hypothetical protein